MRVLWHEKKIISNYGLIFSCFVLLMVYLTLSVSQIMRRQVMGQLVHNDLEDTWKEALMTSTEILPQNLSGVTEEILI
jgi:hypothetical protein